MFIAFLVGKGKLNPIYLLGMFFFGIVTGIVSILLFFAGFIGGVL